MKYGFSKKVALRVFTLGIALFFLGTNLTFVSSSKAVDVLNFKNQVDAYWASNTAKLVINISLIDTDSNRNLKASELKGFRVQIFDLGNGNSLPSTPVIDEIVATTRKPNSNGIIFSNLGLREELSWSKPTAGHKYVIKVAISTTFGDGPQSQSAPVQVPQEFIYAIKPSKTDPKSWQHWYLSSTESDSPLYTCVDTVGNGCGNQELAVNNSRFVKYSYFSVGRAEYLRINCDAVSNPDANLCSQNGGYPPTLYLEIADNAGKWKTVDEVVLDVDSSPMNLEAICANNEALCSGIKKVRLRNDFGIVANFSFNFGGSFNPVGQKCTTVGEIVQFGYLRENGEDIYTKKAICTATNKGKIYVEQAVKLLPYCNSTQDANLWNIKRQALALSQLRDTYQTQKQKAELQYSQAIATGNSTAANIAKIDINSWQSKINEILGKMNTLDSQRNSILSKCRIKDPNATGATSAPSTKKIACTSSEKSRMQLLANQYSTKQNLIRVSDESYGKFAEQYKLAVSNGKLDLAATYRIQMDTWYQRLQEDLTSATLIKNEFNSIYGGCTNPGVSLPSNYLLRYAK